MQIRNLAELKMAIRPGTEFLTTSHEHNGVTCLLFPFSEDVKLDIGKLASWRLSAYRAFGGTWLSDYVPNQLGGFIARREDDNIPMDTTERKVENKMNDWNRLHRQAETIKELYPAGTRVLLLQMGDDPDPVENNMRGTVTAVDDIGTVFCKFDNGRSLGLISGEDSFRKLTAQELAEEQRQKMSEPAMEMSV